ncbi:hypothetical protein PRZ01_17330 [Paucibacter sp. hw1]|uniref:Glycosyltransferase family 9 (Heptosyltransferase) n=1 Tax=Roseateles koreensis TaxID=2987526 RepID=A0ABT5KVI8_9BURK|nr:hypothetical protein [Roseateles koreensis]
MTDTPPSAYIDVSDMRLGDRMACAWWAQQRRMNEGLRFALLDRNFKLAERFSLALFFPATFTEMSEAEIKAANLPEWHQSNLWLTVTNAFAKTQLAGHFEYLPPEVLQRAEEIRRQKTPGKPRVLIHQLNDAPYNRVRNWKQCDADALPPALTALGFDVLLLNPKAKQFIGGYTEMLAQMLVCDAFIGGDTGPSHVFALLCADKPQVAIYPDMTRNEKMYEWQRVELGVELPWSSMPLRPDLAKLTLRHTRHWVFERGLPRWHRVGRFKVEDAVNTLLSVMPAPR